MHNNKPIASLTYQSTIFWCLFVRNIWRTSHFMKEYWDEDGGHCNNDWPWRAEQFQGSILFFVYEAIDIKKLLKWRWFPVCGRLMYYSSYDGSLRPGVFWSMACWLWQHPHGSSCPRWTWPKSPICIPSGPPCLLSKSRGRDWVALPVLLCVLVHLNNETLVHGWLPSYQDSYISSILALTREHIKSLWHATLSTTFIFLKRLNTRCQQSVALYLEESFPLHIEDFMEEDRKIIHRVWFREIVQVTQIGNTTVLCCRYNHPSYHRTMWSSWSVMLPVSCQCATRALLTPKKEHLW